ncbi:MAG TPA: helix-turn-helix transcriptional regulator, partial [Vicinamibacteria bacterium]
TSLERPVEEVADLARFLLVAGVLTASLRLRPDFLRPPTVEADAPVLDPRLAAELRRLVEQERVYRQEGLTIGALAQRLATHEHKVRELINDQLGFRNFNAFLNHYRIREAQQVLANPEARHRNVAEVAYEVGFRSLGPFNKAFKDATGRTPTEFRGVRLG